MKSLLVFLTLLSHSFLAYSIESGQEKKVTSITEAVEQGTVKGLLRYNGHYRDSELHILQDGNSDLVSNEQKQQYSALGGYLGFETAPLFNTSIGATLYTANSAGNNPDNRLGLGGLDEDDGGQESYSVLGEAFVKYQRDGHSLTVGRQEIKDFRFVAWSNIRMTPVTHQGLAYRNNSHDNLKINVAYINKQKDRNATDFVGMVRSARVKTGCGALDELGGCVDAGSKQVLRGEFNRSNYGADGGYTGDNKAMWLAGVEYGVGAYQVEAWNYHVEDFLNFVYLYGQYQIAPPNSQLTYTLAAQYADQQDAGSQVVGSVDTWFYGAKFQIDAPGLSFFTAYNEVDYNEESYDGGTLFVTWGAPQMFNSFQVQDSELAGTKSYGAGLQYDFGHAGVVPGLVVRVRHGIYDLPDDISKMDARQDREETTLDIRYSFSQESGFGIFTELEGLSVQFRLAYNDFETDYDYAAFQSRYGYEFESVSDDFLDARLYIDYMF